MLWFCTQKIQKLRVQLASAATHSAQLPQVAIRSTLTAYIEVPLATVPPTAHNNAMAQPLFCTTATTVKLASSACVLWPSTIQSVEFGPPVSRRNASAGNQRLGHDIIAVARQGNIDRESAGQRFAHSYSAFVLGRPALLVGTKSERKHSQLR